MATRSASPETGLVQGHPVVLLVSAVDRRILPALRFVARLPNASPRALHVSIDPAESRRLANDWMAVGLSWLPLHIVEPAPHGVAAAVRRALDGDPDLLGAVTVVVPELNIQRWWHPFLHRQSARQIAAELQGTARISTVIVPLTV